MVWFQHKRKLSRKCTLIGNAWIKSAIAENAINGFRATDISPLNSAVMPEHFYRMSGPSATPTSVINLSSNVSQGKSSHQILKSNFRFRFIH